MIEALGTYASRVVLSVRRFWMLATAIVMLPTSSLTTYWHNQVGMSAAARGDKLGAYRGFVRALESDPLDPLLQVNLALTFEMNEEYDKAAQTYETLRTEVANRDPLDRMSAANPMGQRTKGFTLMRILAFNHGNVLGKSRQLPAALASYQVALDEGGEPLKVKTNIELLFQKGGGQGDGDSNSDDKNQQNDPKKGDPPKDGKDDKKDQRDNQKKREDSLKQPPEKNKDKDKGKDKPKPFDSQDLRPEDVKRILDEIKNQEQSIRAQEYDKQPKDGARGGKDW